MVNTSFSENNLGGEEQLKRLADLIKSVETTLKRCSKKYKDRNEIEDLYATLTSFLNRENLNDTRFYDDLNSIEKDLKKSNGLNESGRRKFAELKDRLKHLNTELKSMKTMLDKSNASWARFDESVDVLETWLDEQDRIGDKHNIDFSSYQKNQRLHTQLNDSANFLLQISEPSTCSRLKDKLVTVNKRWKMYQERFKETNNEQLLKYYECEHSLNMVRERLSKIDTLVVGKQCKCTQSSVSRYQDELHKAGNDIECLDANLKLINKLSARIGGELRNDPKMVRFLEELRQAEAKLAYFRTHVPECVKTLGKIHSFVTSIEEGVQLIESWCAEADCLIRAEPEHLTLDQLQQQLDKQRRHFNEFNYHENFLVNKLQQFECLKKLATQNLDYSDLNNKLNRVKDALISLNERRAKWEKAIEAQQNIWKMFHGKTKLLEEWILNAQQIVTEKNDDLNYLIQKHEKFFDNVNEQLFNDVLIIGERLLNIKYENDRNEIKILMETLEGQWKMILNHAPMRLLKLEFKRIEAQLRRDLKQAEIELNEENAALRDAVNPDEILQRHESVFRRGEFVSRCEIHLDELRTRCKELAASEADRGANWQEICLNLEENIGVVRREIDDMFTRLRVLPQTCDLVENALPPFDAWMNEVNRLSAALFDPNLSSPNDYRRVVENLMPLLDETEQRGEELKAIKSKLEFILSENRSSSSSKRSSQVRKVYSEVENRLHDLSGRINAIENRVDYVKLVGKLSHEFDRIANEIHALSALSERRFICEVDDECCSSVQAAVEEHKSGVLDKIKALEMESERLREETQRATAAAVSSCGSDQQVMPVYMDEKMSNVAEMIRQTLSQELDRRSSLLEIKQLDDQRQMKFKSLARNLDVLQTILTSNLKNGGSSISRAKSTENSMNELYMTTHTTVDYEDGENTSFKNCSQHREVKKYLSRLDKCRDLIDQSKQILAELQSQSQQLQQHQHQQTKNQPSFKNETELIEFEMRLKQYEFEINQQIELFDTSLAKNDKLDVTLDGLSKRVVDLARKIDTVNEEFTSSSMNMNETAAAFEIPNNNAFSSIETKLEQVRDELAHIEAIQVELDRVANEKNLLLENDSRRNSSQTRIQSRLLEGFNDTVLDLDVKKDRELTNRLNRISHELKLMHEKCTNKIKELNHKRERMIMREEHLQSDLLLESDAVLLDKGLLNETCASHSPETSMVVGGVEIKIEHERSLDRGVTGNNDMLVVEPRPYSLVHESQLQEEERIEEITVDYVISTNEATGEAVIEEETSQMFEKIQSTGHPHALTGTADLSASYCSGGGRLVDRSEFRQRHLYDDDIIEMERQKLEEEILKREFEERAKMERFERELAMKSTRQIETALVSATPVTISNIDTSQQQRELEPLSELTEEENERSLLMTDNDEQVEHELERLRRIELRREESLRMERLEIERIRAERDGSRSMLVVERSRLDDDDQERSRIERMEKDREHERLVRREIDALKALEREREEKFRVERIELERLREEKEMLERSRIEEEERLRLEQIENMRLEEARKQEEERMRREQEEEEQRRRRLKQQYQQEKKLKLEQRLKEICDQLNRLKERMAASELLIEPSSNTSATNHAEIDSFEHELNSIRDEIDHLEATSSAAAAAATNSDMFELVIDQTILTQIELVKSFVNYLTGKLAEKKREARRFDALRVKLAECEANLARYVDLARQLITSNAEANSRAFFVESRGDLQSRIESIESIERSIHECLAQIAEIRCSFHHTSPNSSRHNKDEEEEKIDETIIKPLSQQSSNLKTYLADLDAFSEHLSSLKHFLQIELDWENLTNEMRSNRPPQITSDILQSSSDQPDRYSRLRDKLARRMAQSNDLFVLGSNLFGSNSSSSIAQEFAQLRESINEASRYLTEMSAVVQCARLRHNKMSELEARANQILNEVDLVDKVSVDSTNQQQQQQGEEDVVVRSIKARLERIVELKKALRSIADEKDMMVNESGDAADARNVNAADYKEFDSRLNRITNSVMCEISMRLDGLIKLAKERLAYLENELHESLVKQLQARSVLEELTSWLKSGQTKLAEIEQTSSKAIERFLVSDKNIEASSQDYTIELDRMKSALIELNDEMKVKQRERELMFVVDSIEIEIRQGFYDLKTSEACTRLQSEWNEFKHRLKCSLDRFDLAAIKVRKFNSDLNQINDWIKLRQCQNEFEAYTRLKPSNADRTMLLVDSSFDAASSAASGQGVDENVDDDSILGVIESYRSDLEELQRDWLRDVANEDTRPLLERYIMRKCEIVARRLDDLSRAHKLKLESNLAQLKHDYSHAVNETFAKLAEEMSYLRFGKITCVNQFKNSLNSLIHLLKRVDEKRDEMVSALEKFESKMRASSSSGQERVLRLENLSVEQLVNNSHAIASNLSNRELETSCRALLDRVEANQIVTIWEKYENELEALFSRLDSTAGFIQKDLANVDRIVAEQLPRVGSSLYESTVKEMLENKRAFEHFEATSSRLIGLIDETVCQRAECEFVNDNKLRIQEKFKELARLAEELSQSLEKASNEFKSYTDVTSQAVALVSKSSARLTSLLAATEATHQSNNSGGLVAGPSAAAAATRMLETCGELEGIEAELDECMRKLKQLNLNDSERVRRVLELSGAVGEQLNRARERRAHVMGVIHERSCFVDMKLAEIESSLNRYRNWLEIDKNGRLDKLISEMGSLVDKESELSKYSNELDLLESTYLIPLNASAENRRAPRIIRLREQIQTITTQIKSLIPDLNRLIGIRELRARIRATNTLQTNELVALREELSSLTSSLTYPDLARQEVNETESLVSGLIDKSCQLDELVMTYRVQAGRVEAALNEAEIVVNTPLVGINTSDDCESQLAALKSARQLLNSSALKSDFERLQSLAKRIDATSGRGAAAVEAQHAYERYRIRYYDLLVRIDKHVKSVEFGLGDLKRIIEKSQFLLELIKDSHRVLASISNMKRINIEKSEFLNFSTISSDEETTNNNSSRSMLNNDDDSTRRRSMDGVLRRCSSNNTTNSDEYHQNGRNRTLNECLDILRHKLLTRLSQHEPLKAEIVDMYARLLKSNRLTRSKHELVKSIIDKLLFEWNEVNSVCIEKVKRLEQFKSRLNSLDLRLTKIREHIQKIETYLSCSGGGDGSGDYLLTIDYEKITERKNKLESLLECLIGMDADAENIFNASLSANRAYLGGCSRNESLVHGLRERWSGLKRAIKDRLFKLNNIWILVSDLTDQMENFDNVLGKTEHFYANIRRSSTSGMSSACFMRQIEELYLIINQDYKLIKYLNESYICLVKLVCSIDASSECLNVIKQRLLAINSRWDGLHNEIALRIKSLRGRNENSFATLSSSAPSRFLNQPNVDDLHSWTNEISLLITNLEHLSTKELQLKYHEVQDLKKEICQQTEFLFRENKTANEQETQLKISPCLIDMIKTIMKRIIRLDSFLVQSMPPTARSCSSSFVSC